MKEEYRNYFLLVVSLLFYAWGEPKFVLVMIGSIIFNYLSALFISKVKKAKKVLLTISIVGNLLTLFIFKYLNFAVNNLNRFFDTDITFPAIALPIGISFFTFQAMSYVIDVYRGDVEVQKNPFYLGLYISFFPQLIAGPIVRYHTIEKQIRNRTITLEKFSTGLERFIVGLAKKIIISNNMAVITDYTFNNYSNNNATILLLWLGSLAYTLQIFFDFSGYSDMAIGMGKMFGFDFLENFNYPYAASSITDFWRRWHISLSNWFRDYVYIPLGGNRKGVLRQISNLFIVWLLTGIWHGASWNFIVWGLIYFILLAFEKIFSIPERIEKTRWLGFIYRIFTLLCVNFCWVLFRAVGLKEAIHYAMGMIGIENIPFSNNITIQYLSKNLVILIFAVIYSTGVFKWISNKIGSGSAQIFIKRIGLTIMLIWSLSYLVIGAHNPFIYFNF